MQKRMNNNGEDEVSALEMVATSTLRFIRISLTLWDQKDGIYFLGNIRCDIVSCPTINIVSLS